MTSASSSNSDRAPVTVITPVRDRAHWLGRALESAFAQTLRPAEVIVVDDGSADDVEEVVGRFGGVTLIRQNGEGAYAARNRAVASSTQAFIAFLDSDDAWHPRKLELQMPLFGDPAVDGVFGDARMVVADEWGNTTPAGTTAFERTPPGVAMTPDFILGNPVPFSTLIVRRHTFERVGIFDERLSADWEWLLRLTFVSRLAFVREPVIDYTVHADNWSGNLPRSLDSRIELFQERLASDPAHASVFRHILFVLRLRVALATMRGLWDRGPVRPKTASERAGIAEAIGWTLSLARSESALRLRRAAARLSRR